MDSKPPAAFIAPERTLHGLLPYSHGMPHFSSEALSFLRDLARHNDRPWFAERKSLYERELKAPMLALIAAINETLPAEYVRDPAKILMRIYRDIRFSKDKRPYKTHVAAWWAREGMEKTSGGGFYFDLSPDAITVAAGVYMPAPPQLLAIRRHLLDHHAEFRKLLSGKRLNAVLTPFTADTESPAKLTRVPKGFPADHPAADLLLHRQWGVAARLSADHALSPALLREIAGRFRLAAPIVAFLNTPLQTTPRKPVF